MSGYLASRGNQQEAQREPDQTSPRHLDTANKAEEMVEDELKMSRPV